MTNRDLVIAGALFGAALVSVVWVVWPTIKHTYEKWREAREEKKKAKIAAGE